MNNEIESILAQLADRVHAVPDVDADTFTREVPDTQSTAAEEQNPTREEGQTAEEPQPIHLQNGDLIDLIYSLGGQDSTPTEETPSSTEPVDDNPVDIPQESSQPQATHSPQDSQEDVVPRMNAIEPNENLIIRDETLRFSAAKWFEKAQEKTIVIAGIGGIGSWISLLLSKLRPVALHLYDPDTVELVNMAGQFYGMSDIGKYKVEALADLIINFSNYHSVFTYNTMYGPDSQTEDIMICGFDNMNARRLYYSKWRARVESKPAEERKNCLFIDGRLTAEEVQLLCMTGDDEYYMQQYEQRFLFEDAEASSEVCSFKQTAFLANMIGALAVNIFVNFCANQTESGFPRPIPFFTQYKEENMFLTLER